MKIDLIIISIPLSQWSIPDKLYYFISKYLRCLNINMELNTQILFYAVCGINVTNEHL